MVITDVCQRKVFLPIFWETEREREGEGEGVLGYFLDGLAKSVLFIRISTFLDANRQQYMLLL
jgi:hypothetical protein